MHFIYTCTVVSVNNSEIIINNVSEQSFTRRLCEKYLMFGVQDNTDISMVYI